MRLSSTALPLLADLTSTHISDCARASGEPDWMVEQRVAAWEHFAQALPPIWKRTKLTKLAPEGIQPTAAPQGTAIQWDESSRGQGVIFTTLAAALQDYGTLVKERFGTAVDPLAHKFSALRAALWQDGAFLYVPKNVSVELPLRVCFTLPDGSRALFPYSIIIVEPGAKVTLVEEFSSHDATESALVAPTTEIFLGEGSEYTFASVQQLGANVYHIGGQAQLIHDQARSTWVSVSLGGQTQHIEAEAKLLGEGSAVKWLGGTFANHEQNLLIAPILRHIGAHTESNLDFKSVVTDRGYSIFDGLVKIDHGSRATTTRLEEHAIHLSQTARSDSIPGLKIDTNDVASAGHAATSGQVDDDQLFYMMSRGISRSEAIRMIVMGIFEPVIDALPVEEMRDEIIAAIEAKI